jgi:hypothetical protein
VSSFLIAAPAMLASGAADVAGVGSLRKGVEAAAAIRRPHSHRRHIAPPHCIGGADLPMNGRVEFASARDGGSWRWVGLARSGPQNRRPTGRHTRGTCVRGRGYLVRFTTRFNRTFGRFCEPDSYTRSMIYHVADPIPDGYVKSINSSLRFCSEIVLDARSIRGPSGMSGEPSRHP